MIEDLVAGLTDAAGGLCVTDPATGEAIASVRTYSDADVATIVDRADAARFDWAKRTAKDRARILRAWHDLVMARQDELARIVTTESGKPIAEARAEIAYGAAFIEWFAEEGRRAYGETIPSFSSDRRLMTIRQPVGTCAAVTPWNFPVAMITRKVAPALAAGCAIIVKPAEETPLSALAIEQLAHRAGVPEDLFRVVPTEDPAMMGALFCSHPRIRKLSFTGSTHVGKLLMAQAARNVTRISLELGGNAPFIVFDDADIDAAVEGAIASKFRNAGQTCVCANRFLVQAGIHDIFVERLVERVARLVQAPGSNAASEIGPLINDAARLKVEGLVAQAIGQGAKAHMGGRLSDLGGNFYAPTILTDVAPTMDIVVSEIFGPVAPIIRFRDEAEAVRLANDTPYGLAAYLFTRDNARIWRVMEALEAGMVAVNDGILSTEVAPFGGIKQSGIGREGSMHGLSEYLELKYCLIGGVG